MEADEANSFVVDWRTTPHFNLPQRVYEAPSFTSNVTTGSARGAYASATATCDRVDRGVHGGCKRPFPGQAPRSRLTASYGPPAGTASLPSLPKLSMMLARPEMLAPATLKRRRVEVKYAPQASSPLQTSYERYAPHSKVEQSAPEYTLPGQEQHGAHQSPYSSDVAQEQLWMHQRPVEGRTSALSSSSPPKSPPCGKLNSQMKVQAWEHTVDSRSVTAAVRGQSPPSRSLSKKPQQGSSLVREAAELINKRSPTKRESITKLLLQSEEFLNTESLVRNHNNEIDWVATFLNVGFEANSIYAIMCPLRKGRWKAEEERYTLELLRLIEDGTIRLQHGQSIRSFIARKLHSDEMRVLKKLSNCRMFQFAKMITPRMSDQEEVDMSHPGVSASLERLGSLKSEFLRSVQLEALVAVRKYLSDSSIKDLLTGNSTSSAQAQGNSIVCL